MSTQTLNGKPRKQLSDQLDRLDGIIDLLAEGLPQAVADAAREGTRQAVKDAIVEILSNPDLRAMLTPLAPTPSPQPVYAPPPVPEAVPAGPSVWSRMREKVASARTAVAEKCKSAVTTVTTAARTLNSIVPLKRIAIIGTAAGAVVATVSYAAPHSVSAVIAGIGGAATAVAVQVGAWVRKSARLFGLA